MSRPKTYPNQLFVSLENADTDDPYFQACKSATECAEIGTIKRVGRYMLHEVVKVEGRVVVSGTTTGN